MFQGILCIIGVICFMRMWQIRYGNFPKHPNFFQARLNYLLAYGCLAAGMGIPMLLGLFFQYVLLPGYGGSAEEFRHLRSVAGMIDKMALICYVGGLVGTLIFHLCAARLDTNHELYYTILGRKKKPNAAQENKDLLKKAEKLS